MRFWLLPILVAALVQSSIVDAQSTEGFDPAGYWTGAIIKDGSVLPVEVEIVRTQDGHQATTAFPDWYFSQPSSAVTVRTTSQGMIIPNLLAGDAVMELEPRFQQLTGTVGDDGRRIHLKRAPAAPMPLVDINADGIHFRPTERVSPPQHPTPIWPARLPEWSWWVAVGARARKR
ncbi:MAG: hypothetical protein HC870_00535 [Rhizobiales bacterium]|nr:hypothetical protein [Hyphomicrobiales bacterium]